jgi:hypothetical protein
LHPKEVKIGEVLVTGHSIEANKQAAPETFADGHFFMMVTARISAQGAILKES